MALSDFNLNANPVPDVRRARGVHASDFSKLPAEYKIDYDATASKKMTGVSISTPSDATPLPPSASEQEHRERIESQTGLTIDPNLEVVQERLSLMAGGKNYWLKYKFVPRQSAIEEAERVDPVAILKRLNESPRPVSRKSDGDDTFMDNINDTQFGKDAGGGTDATLERLDGYNDLLEERQKELRKMGRKLGELVVMGGGDIIEGCSIYPNQSFQIDRDIRGQEETAVAYILDYLLRFAPKFKKVRVPVVGGNHGQHRINGKRINRHDNADAKVFRMAAIAAENNPKLSHVQFYIAQEEAAITFDVQGWIYAITHGDVYGKGNGGEPTLKAWNWYRNQAAGRTPVGDADVIVANHFHHLIVKNWGKCLFVQNGAQDGGSPEFADYSGGDALAGRNTWTVSADHKFRDHQELTVPRKELILPNSLAA